MGIIIGINRNLLYGEETIIISTPTPIKVEIPIIIIPIAYKCMASYSIPSIYNWSSRIDFIF